MLDYWLEMVDNPVPKNIFVSLPIEFRNYRSSVYAFQELYEDDARSRGVFPRPNVVGKRRIIFIPFSKDPFFSDSYVVEIY